MLVFCLGLDLEIYCFRAKLWFGDFILLWRENMEPMDIVGRTKEDASLPKGSFFIQISWFFAILKHTLLLFCLVPLASCILLEADVCRWLDKRSALFVPRLSVRQSMSLQFFWILLNSGDLLQLNSFADCFVFQEICF